MHFTPLIKRIHDYIISNESNILKQHHDVVKAAIKPALFIDSEKRTESASDSRKSKIGGKPLVNDEMAEFLKQNKDYVFVFQLDFVDIKEYAQELNMPTKGLISVFIKATSQNNLQYLDPTYVKVFFNTDIKEIDYKYKPQLNIQQSLFAFKEMLSIPEHEDDVWKEMVDAYEDFPFEIHEQLSDKIIEVCNISYSTGSQVGGYEQSVQDSVLFDFAALSLIDEQVYTKAYYDDYQKRWDEIIPLSQEYIMICQVDTGDFFANFKGCLDGVLYIGIRKDELKNNDFSNLKFVVQNT